MKHSALYSLIFCSILGAQESSLEEYISDMKMQEFSYDQKKALLDKKQLRDSWIQPLQLRYTISKSNPYNEQGTRTQKVQNAAIVMDQPIFKSGGIYYGIKYAEASYKYRDYSIEVAKRKLIKEAVSLLIQIRQADLSISKQKFQIDNSRINLEQKKEQYLNGQLDSGYLNNAIIEKNSVTKLLYDLQTKRERLISQFGAISDLSYEDATLPNFELIEEEKFLEENIDIQQSRSEEQMKGYNRNVVRSKYLPSVSITAGYTWDKIENPSFAGIPGISSPPETQYYNYGLKATMPLDFNSLRDMESARVEYLKSLVLVDNKKRQMHALYEQVTQNLDNFAKKIELSLENEKLYRELLKDTKQLYIAGYKTEYDVKNLENSVEIEKIDQELFGLERQLELLNLYEKLINEV